MSDHLGRHIAPGANLDIGHRWDLSRNRGTFPAAKKNGAGDPFKFHLNQTTEFLQVPIYEIIIFLNYLESLGSPIETHFVKITIRRIQILPLPISCIYAHVALIHVVPWILCVANHPASSAENQTSILTNSIKFPINPVFQSCLSPKPTSSWFFPRNGWHRDALNLCWGSHPSRHLFGR